MVKNSFSSMFLSVLSIISLDHLILGLSPNGPNYFSDPSLCYFEFVIIYFNPYELSIILDCCSPGLNLNPSLDQIPSVPLQ